MAEGTDPWENADLAGAAQAGLADTVGDGAAQQPLEGMEYRTHLGFNGMALRTNDTDYKLGDEGVVLVRYRVTQVGDQLMKDGHERHVVKADVLSVTVPEAE